MPTTHVCQVDEESFQEQVLESPVPVLVDFATAWCPPCRVLAPILRRFSAEVEGRVKVASVAADECPALAARFSVRGYPTIIAFAEGEERARHLGVTGKEKLMEMVEACRRA
jgi:thioredoxin 1